ncbi:MAG TPA: hypothetical protein DC042_18655 [Bacteroidales bacterium]|nr:hypothetical protein [Bacteroidales bacterium]
MPEAFFFILFRPLQPDSIKTASTAIRIPELSFFITTAFMFVNLCFSMYDKSKNVLKTFDKKSISA